MTDRLATVFSEVLEIPADQVADGLTPETSGAWDSLAMVNLILAIETEFEIDCDLDDLLSFTSVGRVRELIRGKGIDV